jgi:hypothetical protein
LALDIKKEKLRVLDFEVFDRIYLLLRDTELPEFELLAAWLDEPVVEPPETLVECCLFFCLIFECALCE